jgi:tetratricopeptide (TPR) repeat protein
MARGAFHAALGHFQNALSDDPNDAVAHATLSLCLARMDRRYGALEEAKRALALDPNLPISHVARGAALMLMSDEAGARRSLAQAKALDPYDANALQLACILALDERKPAALRAAAEELIARRPGDPDAKEYMSRAASLAGDGRKAEQLAREALQENPESPDYHVALGWAFVAQGKHAKARDAALTALAISGGNRPALSLLALAKLRAAPLTGWIHWLQLWLVRQSETTRAAAITGILAAKLFGDQVLRHYQMPVAKDALDYTYLALIAVTWLSYFWITAALRRDVQNVRLRAY